jgi:hypothetical protein
LGPSSHGRLSSAPRAPWHVGLSLVLHKVGLLLLLAPLDLLESAFLTLFHCFQPCFCNCDYSTGIHGNRSVAHVYVCIDVYFPPFWAYVGGINLSIRTTNRDRCSKQAMIGLWPRSADPLLWLFGQSFGGSPSHVL